MRRTKSLSRDLFLKGGLRGSPSYRRLRLCQRLGNACVRWPLGHRGTNGWVSSHLRDLLHGCRLEGPVPQVGSKHCVKPASLSTHFLGNCCILFKRSLQTLWVDSVFVDIYSKLQMAQLNFAGWGVTT